MDLNDFALMRAQEQERRRRVIRNVAVGAVVFVVLAGAVGHFQVQQEKEEARERYEESERARNDALRHGAMEGRARQPYSDLIETAARGGPTTTALAAAFAAEQMEGFEPERTRPDIHEFVEGTMRFGGRQIPAARGKAMLPMINRADGKKRWMCVLFAAGDDRSEFDMWRQIEVRACDGAGSADAIEEWARQNSFESR